MKRFTIQCLSLLLIAAFKLYGAHYYVSAAGTVYGDGTESNPFPWIELGLERAGPGDTVELAPDEFYEKVSFPRSGKSGAPIVLLGCLCFGTVLHADGTVIDVDQKHIIIDFMQIDGGFGESEVIRVGENADSLIIRNSEIRNSRDNGIEIDHARGVLIENCTIHHLLAGRLENQKATYGVAGKGATDLTVLRCEIYKVSGYCVQVGHDLVNNLLWDNVVIEDCYFWTDSLLKDMDAWRKGEIPGRGAVEILAEGTDNSYMKAPAIVLSNIKARGWAEGYINNQAGFEIKGKVECLADRIRCYGCDIAFRLSGSTGSPLVTLTNSVVYKCEKVLQVGNGLEDLHIYNCTFGAGNVGLIEESGGGSGAGLEMKNCLVLAGEKPLYMADSSNLAASEDWFVSVANNDYHLSPGAPAVGAGVFIPGVESDFDGKLRPVQNPSVGAYESAEAAEANYMRLAEVEAAARSRFTVGLYYGSSAIIGEFKFSVSFDRTALELESLTQVGKAYTMTVVQSDIAAANESGTAAFSLADLSGYFPIQPGAGEIVQLVFKDIAGIAQEVVLTLSDLGATTPWGAELDYTPRNGKVTIVAGNNGSCDLNGDGSVDIRDVIAFLLLGRDYPADLRLDWNGDGRYSITDAVQLLLDISHGNCPDSPELSAAGKAKSTLSPRLSGDDIRYIERILKQMNLTQEQEAEFRLALYGESGPPVLPGSFSLSQNYPNPFNPATTIAFDMPSGCSGQVKIEIYDLRGRLVRTLVDGVREPGRHEIFWDGTDSDGRTSASGVYIYRMQAGSFSTTRKMVLLK